MREPVVAADGHSYEKEAILEWLRKGKRISPLTGENLKFDTVIHNFALKKIIDSYRNKLPKI